jgi:LmbE family N-acetylglucosaminyl deacetylase
VYAMESSARNPLLHPRHGDVVVFLLAHPDDESLFTGGTLARLASAGAVTVLVTATLGELGRPNDPLVRTALSDDVPIALVRKEELRRACTELGVTHHLSLGGEGRFCDSGYEARNRHNDSFTTNSEVAPAELVAVLDDVSCLPRNWYPRRRGDDLTRRPLARPRVYYRCSSR